MVARRGPRCLAERGWHTEYPLAGAGNLRRHPVGQPGRRFLKNQDSAGSACRAERGRVAHGLCLSDATRSCRDGGSDGCPSSLANPPTDNTNEFGWRTENKSIQDRGTLRPAERTLL